MNLLFNNLYIFLFIILFILDIILQQVLKKQNIQDDISSLLLFNYLHKLKNHSITFSVFILLLYFSIVISPLLLLRVNRLGLVYDLPNVGEGTLDYKIYIPVIFMLLSFMWLLKIANFILYLYVIKMHFYLYYISEYYINNFTEYAFFKDPILDNFCKKIMIFCYRLYKTNRSFIKSYKFERKTQIILRKNPDNIKTKWLFYLYLRHYINKYMLLTLCMKNISDFFHFLSFYASRVMYYSSYSLLVITLGYDITHGVIQYTFYATLYLYITNIIKKIRKFYKEKDPLLDHQLGTYFYNNINAYHQVKVLLENHNISSKYPEIAFIFENKSEIIDYINSDFIVDYLRRPERTQGKKIIFNTCKRLNILFVLLIFNFYMLYHNKYILIVNNTSISLTFIISVYLGLMYYLHQKIPEEIENSWIEHKTPKRLFYILLLILSMFLGFIFLKNKFTLDPQDIIISFQDIISIKENFTLTDKLNYVRKYINYLKLEESLDKSILEKIQKDIIENNVITLKITFEELKEIIIKTYKQKKYT